MKCTPRPTADIKMEAMPGVEQGGMMGWGEWVREEGVGVVRGGGGGEEGLGCRIEGKEREGGKGVEEPVEVCKGGGRNQKGMRYVGVFWRKAVAWGRGEGRAVPQLPHGTVCLSQRDGLSDVPSEMRCRSTSHGIFIFLLMTLINYLFGQTK